MNKLIRTIIIFCTSICLYSCGSSNPSMLELTTISEDLKIEITLDSTRYYRGKAINLFMRITNKSLQRLNYYGIGKFNLINLENDNKIKDVNGLHDDIPSGIEPGATHNYSFSLLPFYAHQGEDTILYAPHFIGLGRYSFSITTILDGGVNVNSNSINFEILPLPEEYKVYYDLLQSKKYSMKEIIEDYENHKDSFFGYEFHTRLMRSLYINWNYYSESPKEREKADNFVIEYLTKYPNSGYAYRLVNVLVEKVEKDLLWFTENKQQLLNDSTWTSILLRDRLERRKK